MRKENRVNTSLEDILSVKEIMSVNALSFGALGNVSGQSMLVHKIFLLIFLYFTNIFFVYLLIFKRRNHCWAMPKEKKITGVRSNPKLTITLR